MPGEYRFSFGPWNIHKGADSFGPTVRNSIEFGKKLNKKWLAGCVITVTLMILLTATKGEDKENENKQLLGQINGLLSQDSRIRDQAVDSILQDRRAIVNKLIPLIDPANTKKYSDQTRCAAAYLLGMLRATEAVPVLSRALANEPGRKIISDISRYDVPVWTALVRIGRPAVPVMIENIETSDNRILRNKSIDVLYHVLGGKRRVLELLNKLKARAENPLIIEHIEAAIQYTKEHFKEDKEPLY